MSLVRADAARLPFRDESVDLVVTSPPYFSLRAYEDGGKPYPGQVGAEPTPTDFLESLWAVTRECWRVLKPTGSLFVNLGDKYAGSGGHNNSRINGADRGPKRYTQASDGVRDKSLLGLPWRYGLGCVDGLADPDGVGWIMRAELVWSKPNGLPESVEDRVRRSHETWFHFVKSGRYYSAVDELREPYADGTPDRYAYGFAPGSASGTQTRSAVLRGDDGGPRDTNPLGKLPGSVWQIPTEPLNVPAELETDHFAAFPIEWPRRIILGWSPPGICIVCGEGRRPLIERNFAGDPNSVEGERQRARSRISGGIANVTLGRTDQVDRRLVGYVCACGDDVAPTEPAVVLDPFGGTGTTALVANALGRVGVSIDLSSDYLRLARWRVFESDHDLKAIERTFGRGAATLTARRRLGARNGFEELELFGELL